MNLININKLNCFIDLHLHLDGAIFLPSIIDLADRQNINLNKTNEEIINETVAKERCKNLEEFLGKFSIPCMLLKTYDGVKYGMINLLNELKKQGLMYVEIRFAPQILTDNGLRQEEIVKAALDGMKEVDIDSNLILCCMKREHNEQENIETVEVAHKFLNKGVCAIDVAGPEKMYPIDNFTYIFELAHKYNIPFTIHTGEGEGPISVWNSLKFKPNRIGHGIRSIEDEDLMDELEKIQIPLECCPTSNIKTSIFETYKDYPLKKFLDHNIVVTINTDDPAIEDTNIKNEYQKLIDNIGLNDDDVYKLLINSAKSSFASEEIKKKMIDKINSEFNIL